MPNPPFSDSIPFSRKFLPSDCLSRNCAKEKIHRSAADVIQSLHAAGVILRFHRYGSTASFRGSIHTAPVGQQRCRTGHRQKNARKSLFINYAYALHCVRRECFQSMWVHQSEVGSFFDKRRQGRPMSAPADIPDGSQTPRIASAVRMPSRAADMMPPA